MRNVLEIILDTNKTVSLP